MAVLEYSIVSVNMVWTITNIVLIKFLISTFSNKEEKYMNYIQENTKKLNKIEELVKNGK